LEISDLFLSLKKFESYSESDFEIVQWKHYTILITLLFYACSEAATAENDKQSEEVNCLPEFSPGFLFLFYVRVREPVFFVDLGENIHNL